MAEERYRDLKGREVSEVTDFTVTSPARIVQPSGSVRFKTPRGVRFTPREGVRFRPIRTLVVNGQVMRVRQRQEATASDYATFKATIEAVASDIKKEIRDQHRETRGEIQTSRRDILAAIKASPAASIKLISEFGSLFLVFALILHFALKIELVNPVFAIFMLFCFGLYWLMAQVKQKAEERERTNH